MNWSSDGSIPTLSLHVGLLVKKEVYSGRMGHKITKPLGNAENKSRLLAVKAKHV